MRFDAREVTVAHPFVFCGNSIRGGDHLRIVSLTRVSTPFLRNLMNYKMISLQIEIRLSYLKLVGNHQVGNFLKLKLGKAISTIN